LDLLKEGWGFIIYRKFREKKALLSSVIERVQTFMLSMLLLSM
jgi:hypothetical protein